jgi:hypothetical protein
MPKEQSGSTHNLAAAGAGITAAMTPTKMVSKVTEGLIVQIGGGKRSKASPANNVLGGSYVLASGDLRVAALKQRFRESLDECSCRTAADLSDACRSVKIL